MEIIKGILTEDDVVNYFTDNDLRILASCSSSVIIHMVKEYLKRPSSNEVVQELVRDAYRSAIVRYDLAENPSQEIKDRVEALREFTYESVNPSLDIETLLWYKEMILGIMQDEDLVAYTVPINGSVIDNFVNEKIASAGSDDEKKFFKSFSTKRKYFKETRHAKARGTIVKHILTNGDKWSIILKGIDFMVVKLKAGDSPESWRYL